MTFFILLATGILLSFPVGPMGLTGSAQAAIGHWTSARLLALGVCLGDGILTAVAIWGMALPLDTIKYMSIFILPCLAIHFWRNAQQVATPPAGHTSLVVGFVSTSANVANILAFTLSFRWMYDNGYVLNSLTEKFLLPFAVAAGAMLVWTVFLMRSRRLSDSDHFQRWRPVAFRAISVGCLCLTVLQVSEMSSSF